MAELFTIFSAFSARSGMNFYMLALPRIHVSKEKSVSLRNGFL
jgi:hypothetical protein